MRARDIMTRTVHTVGRHTPVRDVIGILLEHRISGVPVVDDGRVVGIVTEGDLILRERAHRQRGGMAYLFQQLFEDHAKLADEYRKAHGILAEDVMTRDVVTIRPGTPVEEIANLLAEKHIKRVPVVDRDRLVGIVSRADVLKAAADRLTHVGSLPRRLTDREIEEKIVQSLATEPWAEVDRLEVECSRGHVWLRGTVENEAEREAVEVAAREVPGVNAVTNELVVEATPPGEPDRPATS
jgi:CBS domain-containing protein